MIYINIIHKELKRNNIKDKNTYDFIYTHSTIYKPSFSEW